MNLQGFKTTIDYLAKMQAQLNLSVAAHSATLKQEIYKDIFQELNRLGVTDSVEIQLWSFDDQPWSDGGRTYAVSPCMRISYDFEGEPWFEDLEAFISNYPDEIRDFWGGSSYLITLDPTNNTIVEDERWFGEY